MAMLRFLLPQLMIISSVMCFVSVTAFSSFRACCSSSTLQQQRPIVVAAAMMVDSSLLTEDEAVVPSTNNSSATLPTTNNDEEFYYDDVVRTARDDLVSLSQALTSATSSNTIVGIGKNVFLRRPSDAIRLVREIDRLEAIVIASSSNDNKENNFQRRQKTKELLVGDWVLIATANVPSSRFRGRATNDNNKKINDGRGRKSKGIGWVNDGIRFEVTQRIRCTANEKGETDGESNVDDGNNTTTATTMEIDRVDNVIEIFPPTDENNILRRLLNPLSIARTKLVLIHNANIESVSPVLRTKIAWVSTVLNVAGTSSASSSNNQFFDVNGQDLLGINNLFGEFLNVGSFETPYVDERVRVSRSPGPVFETVRVFVRKEENTVMGDR